MPRDLYAALGRPRGEADVRRDGRGPDVPLPHDATQAEVDKAADAALLRHHPDRNPSDDGTCSPGSASARFRDAKLARDVLCDPEKRALYDSGLWSDPDDPQVSHDAGAPSWHRAVTDPAKRQVLGGFVEAACVLGGLDQDAASLASDVAIGAAVGAVEVARSPEPLARAAVAITGAAKKLSHPEGRAALREAGTSLQAAWRKVFG